MSAMRILSPSIHAVSPSTTQFVPPPVWQITYFAGAVARVPDADTASATAAG